MGQTNTLGASQYMGRWPAKHSDAYTAKNQMEQKNRMSGDIVDARVLSCVNL